MTVSPLRSGLRPPSDPSALRRWLVRKEDALIAVLTPEITGIVRRSLKAFEATLPSLVASGDMSVFDDLPADWLGIVDNRLLPAAEEIFLSGGISVWGAAPTSAISAQAAQGWAAIVNESARTYLTERRNLLVGVGDNLFQGVIAQVDKALSTGSSAEEVKTNLEQLGQFSEFRADTIARNEIQNAYANGNYASANALGEYGPVEKMWLATSDPRTRETHAAINGTVLAWSESFQVGNSLMLHPHDPNGSAAESIQCRCILLEFWPGDQRPDGSIVGERPVAEVTPTLQPAPIVPDEQIVQAAEAAEVAEVAPLRPGPGSVRTFGETIKLPEASKGRLKERVQAMRETTEIMDRIHGSPGILPEIDVTLGGKADMKGGHFATATRGPRPKRSAKMSVQEWNAKVHEYNARSARPEIRVNDTEISQQVSDLTHEVGHAIDWDGKSFISQRAWQSMEVANLQRKYRGDWLDHIEEIADEQTRLIAELGQQIRNAESARMYTKGKMFATKQYHSSIEEVWARSYAQWIAEASGDARLLANIKEMQKIGYTFTDEEFVGVRPIIERVLRLRGLLE